MQILEGIYMLMGRFLSDFSLPCLQEAGVRCFRWRISAKKVSWSSRMGEGVVGLLGN